MTYENVNDTNAFWYEGNMSDEGATPARPARGREWRAPSGYPSAERPYTWSR